MTSRSPACSATRSSPSGAGRARAISSSLALSRRGAGGLAVVAAYDRRIAAGLRRRPRPAPSCCCASSPPGSWRWRARCRARARTALRLALANIHRPGALTPSVVLSLGLGVMPPRRAVADRRQLPPPADPRPCPSRRRASSSSTSRTPRRGALRRFHAGAGAGRPDRARADAARAPRRAERRAGREIKAAEKAAWVLDGDRGITYAATLPAGSTRRRGEWWPKDYQRPAARVVRRRRLPRGLASRSATRSSSTCSGRNIAATHRQPAHGRMALARHQFRAWCSRPNTFAGAPHTHLATFTFPGGSDAGDEATSSRPPRRTIRLSPACGSRKPRGGQRGIS